MTIIVTHAFYLILDLFFLYRYFDGAYFSFL